MNNHTHGKRGYLELQKVDASWLNLTPHTPSFAMNISADTAEDTGMQPSGDFKTYLQGLKGATFDWTINMPDDGAPLIAVNDIMNRTDGTEGGVIRMFPAGKIAGKYYVSAPVVYTNPGSFSVSNSGAVTTTFSCQLSGVPTIGVWA